MKISERAIDRPRIVMVATLVVMVAAVLAVFNTAVERTPSVTLPAVSYTHLPLPTSDLV